VASTTPCSEPIDQPSDCCPSKPALADRHLLAKSDAGELANLFAVLANDTRLRLLHTLVRHGELCVSDLCTEVKMKPQAVSNQLQRLTEWGIVKSRRAGLRAYYQITDPCVTELLDRGLCLLEDAAEQRS
jgi:ArsR family transcriptional regulator, lead/cadmium/zinc/bismuth-responsive transcriptional repressor